MIEPHNAYTVRINPVMPPKAEAKIKVPLSEAYLAVLMAEDARAVRARFSRANGSFTSQAGGEEANRARQVQAIANREALAARALDLITARPRTSAELRETFGMTENRMRAAMGMLRHNGLVQSKRQGPGTVWERTA